MLLGARTKKQLRLASVDPSSRLPSDFQLVHRTAEGRFLSTSGFSPSFFPLFFEASFYATMVLLPGQSTSGEYFSLPPSLYSLPFSIVSLSAYLSISTNSAPPSPPRPVTLRLAASSVSTPQAVSPLQQVQSHLVYIVPIFLQTSIFF